MDEEAPVPRREGWPGGYHQGVGQLCRVDRQVDLVACHGHVVPVDERIAERQVDAVVQMICAEKAISGDTAKTLCLYTPLLVLTASRPWSVTVDTTFVVVV